MKQTTDLTQVKATATMLLYLEPKPIKSVEFLCEHPFLETMFGYVKSSGKMFNVFSDKEDFELWREEMAELIQTRESAMDVMILLRKSYYLTFFKFVHDFLSVTDFTTILRELWLMVEFPLLDLNVSKRELSSWLKFCDKELLMSEEDKKYLDSLPESVKIYRGVADEQCIEGYSWSLSEEKARWFATRFTFDGCSPVLCSFEINKSDIIAYMSARNEAEVVVLPETLENYKINRLYL